MFKHILIAMALCGAACGESLYNPPRVGDISVSANSLIGNITNATAKATNVSIPTCADTGGNHLNYSPVTGFTCGTSSGGGAPTQSSYSPTISSNGNFTLNAQGTFYYHRIGNIVTIFGRVQYTATTASNSSFEFTIPVASNLSSINDVAGTCMLTSPSYGVVAYSGSTTTIRCTVLSPSASTFNVLINASYVVL